MIQLSRLLPQRFRNCKKSVAVRKWVAKKLADGDDLTGLAYYLQRQVVLSSHSLWFGKHFQASFYYYLLMMSHKKRTSNSNRVAVIGGNVCYMNNNYMKLWLQKITDCAHFIQMSSKIECWNIIRKREAHVFRKREIIRENWFQKQWKSLINICLKQTPRDIWMSWKAQNFMRASTQSRELELSSSSCL